MSGFEIAYESSVSRVQGGERIRHKTVEKRYPISFLPFLFSLFQSVQNSPANPSDLTPSSGFIVNSYVSLFPHKKTFFNRT